MNRMCGQNAQEYTGQREAVGRSQILLGITVHIKDFELSTGKTVSYFKQRGDMLAFQKITPAVIWRMD